LSALVANRIALVAIGVAVIGSLVPCRGSESDVDRRTRLQIRHKGNGQEVQDLDPQIVNSVSSLNIISALLEGPRFGRSARSASGSGRG